MKVKKVLCILISILMVLGLFASVSFATEPEPVPDEESFIVFGYYDDGEEDGAVVSVTLNGTAIGEADNDVYEEFMRLTPGQDVNVAIELAEGYELADDTHFVESGIWLYWYGDNTDTDDLDGLGVNKADIEYVNGKPNSIRATMKAPSANTAC